MNILPARILRFPLQRANETMKYPHEFLGRCATCLDNAYLSNEPCLLKMGVNGAPLFEDDCMIFRGRKAYDAARSTNRRDS